MHLFCLVRGKQREPPEEAKKTRNKKGSEFWLEALWFMPTVPTLQQGSRVPISTLGMGWQKTEHVFCRPVKMNRPPKKKTTKTKINKNMSQEQRSGSFHSGLGPELPPPPLHTWPCLSRSVSEIRIDMGNQKVIGVPPQQRGILLWIVLTPQKTHPQTKTP